MGAKSWSFERRSFAKLLGGRAGRGAHLCWTGGIPSFSSTRSLIRSMESVGSMSISISLPVRVFTLIWGEEEKGACCQFWALGGQRALDSGDAPSSWQIGFWVVAVEAGCVGAGARVCGRRLRVRWLVFVLSARRCVKLQILGSLCRKKNPRPRLHRQFWKTRWPALLRHSQEPPSPPDSRRG